MQIFSLLGIIFLTKTVVKAALHISNHHESIMNVLYYNIVIQSIYQETRRDRYSNQTGMYLWRLDSELHPPN